MFTHFHRMGKCEWHEGKLNEFVAHYNRAHGTRYELSRPLDVERTGAATPKAPEVLVVDPTTGSNMVIEKKRVVWPEHYILRHNNWHLFTDVIHDINCNWPRDAFYKLWIDGRVLETLDQKAIRRAATDIATRIAKLQVADLPLKETKPIRWSFRKADSYEYDEADGNPGIVIVDAISVSMEHWLDETPKVETAKEMEKQLTSAVAKFAAYDHARKIVLLDFYGDRLDESDIPPLMDSISVPEQIDEVWMSVRDWCSADEYEIGYERLFPLQL